MKTLIKLVLFTIVITLISCESSEEPFSNATATWKTTSPIPYKTKLFFPGSLHKNKNNQIIYMPNTIDGINSNATHLMSYYNPTEDAWFPVGKNLDDPFSYSRNPIYRLKNTPKGNLLLYDSRIDNSRLPREYKTIVWNLDDVDTPKKIAEFKGVPTLFNESGKVMDNGNIIFTNGLEVKLFDIYAGKETQFSTGQSKQTTMFFPIGDYAYFSNKEEIFKIDVNAKTFQKINLTKNYALGDLDFLFHYGGDREFYLSDGTVLARTKSDKIIKWSPNSDEPDVLKFEEPITISHMSIGWYLAAEMKNGNILIHKKSSQPGFLTSIKYELVQENNILKVKKLFEDNHYVNYSYPLITEDKMYVLNFNRGERVHYREFH